nr:dNTP triphosphohydrolase [Nitrosomonas nitrosa]
MRMDWKKLITFERLGDTTAPKDRTKIDARNEFERDIDRIIFSSEFRRLQDKTQVFPIPKSDFVHTRLTHSLEVAAVGRSLGKLGGKIIKAKEDKEVLEQFRSGHFGNIVAAACLAHDIGNPPIGHSGEDAFRRFFKNQEKRLKDVFNLTQAEISDLTTFEGNASGFRILTNDHPSGRPGGLRLTYSTLAAFSKYPKQSGKVVANKLGSKISDRVSQKEKKFGFFQREQEIFKEVADRNGLIRLSDEHDSWCRHPLAFLVEAADTACYSCIDIEDGYHLGYVSYDHLLSIMEPLAGKVLDNDPCDFQNEINAIKDENEKVGYLRSRALNNIVNLCIMSFEKNYELIMTGEFDSELTDSLTRCQAEFDQLVDFNSSNLYNTRKGVQIEIAGYKILEGLLEFFLEAIENSYDADKEHEKRRSKKILGLLPEYLRPTSNVADSYFNILKVCDFVSRSTDSYAIDIFKKLNGEKFPVID